MLRDPIYDNYRELPKLRGYLTFSFNLNTIKNKINTQRFGRNGFLMLVNNDQKIIFQAKKTLCKNLCVDSTFQNLILEKKSLIKTSLNEVSVLLYRYQLPSNLLLIGILPEKDIYEKSNRLISQSIYISILAIAFMLIFVFITLNWLVLKPIHLLNSAAYLLGQHKKLHEIKINNQDELGELTRTFIKMSKSIEQQHRKISYAANHDSLTGLANRSYFNQIIQNALSVAKNKKVALLFIDLDDFKNVNDTLGHLAGDILLESIAKRILGVLRNDHLQTEEADIKDEVARIGGDEFIILLNNIQKPLDAKVVAQRLITSLENSFKIQDEFITISCSIGICFYPDNASSSEELIQHADAAMYKAKQQGKNRYQFFSKNNIH